MITIVLNGENYQCEDTITLSALLTKLNYKQDMIAIALNQTFIPKNLYDTTQINNGDSIEIVTAMQGG